MTDAFYPITLALNTLWFGAGCWYFAWKRQTAAKLLVPRSARSSPIFQTLAEALPFLGGMNLALCTLSGMLFLRQDLFLQPGERGILLLAFALAHATQFAINVPVARRGGRIGEAYWDVTHGPMLFIFVVDAAMTTLNLLCAAAMVL